MDRSWDRNGQVQSSMAWMFGPNNPWLSSLSAPAPDAAASQVRDELESLETEYRRREASIVFGGHFNSGKSTLLATLIGRDILPIGSLPETGVACHLRRGETDRVYGILPPDEAVEIACDRDAIAEVIGAYTRLGERRSLDEMPAYLAVELADVPIAEEAVWIDSPGINDSPEMTEKAFALALDADLLVWVVSSVQCLSEPEMEFLHRYVEARGTEALRLVLNVFLDDDRAETWTRYSRRELPVLLGRLRESAGELGFDEDELQLYAVSARAAHDAVGDDFGGRGLRDWLAGLTDSSRPEVRQSRRRRAEIAARRCRDRLRGPLERQRAIVAAAESALVEHEDHEKRHKQGGKAASRLFDKAMTAFESRAVGSAESIAEGIVAESLKRDGTYGDELTRAIRAAAPAVDFCDRLAAELAKNKLPDLSRNAREAIANVLRVRAVTVAVPNTPVKGGKIGGGLLAAAVVGAFFTGGLSLLAASAGALGGAAMAGSDAIREDIALTASRLEEQARSEAARLAGLKAKVLKLVEEHCLGAAPTLPPPANREPLRALEALDAQCRMLPELLEKGARLD